MSREFVLTGRNDRSPHFNECRCTSLAHVTDSTHQVALCLHARRTPMRREFVLPGRNDRSPHVSECRCTSLAHVTDCSHEGACCLQIGERL
jgi:hypothetical protein